LDVFPPLLKTGALLILFSLRILFFIFSPRRFFFSFSLSKMLFSSEQGLRPPPILPSCQPPFPASGHTTSPVTKRLPFPRAGRLLCRVIRVFFSSLIPSPDPINEFALLFSNLLFVPSSCGTLYLSVGPPPLHHFSPPPFTIASTAPFFPWQLALPLK